MKAAAFVKAALHDDSDFLTLCPAVWAQHSISYCLLGDFALAAYTAPVVGMDLEIAVIDRGNQGVDRLLANNYCVERFGSSLNVSDAGSEIRVQIQTDPRYAPFVEHAQVGSVLGHEVPVARIEDVLQGKVWAASDPTRRASKRLKDYADIARILERRPDLTGLVPEEIRQRIV